MAWHMAYNGTYDIDMNYFHTEYVNVNTNGYTNNMGVIWTIVIVLLGQWCACGTLSDRYIV